MAPTAAFLVMLALMSDPLFPSKCYYLGSKCAAIDPSTANLGDRGLFSYFVRW